MSKYQQNNCVLYSNFHALYGGIEILATYWNKARGLIGKSESSSCVLLLNCRSIHSFGMRFPIDVAFLDNSFIVKKVYRELCPKRILLCAKARHVIERPSKAGEWLSVGEKISFSMYRDF